MVVRVVLAEDNLLMREGIVSVLALSDEIDLVDTCADYDSLLASVAEHEPGRRCHRYTHAANADRRGNPSRQ